MWIFRYLSSYSELHLHTVFFSNTMWVFKTVQTNERLGTNGALSCEFNWVTMVRTNNTACSGLVFSSLTNAFKVQYKVEYYSDSNKKLFTRQCNTVFLFVSENRIKLLVSGSYCQLICLYWRVKRQPKLWSGLIHYDFSSLDSVNAC